MKYALFTGAAGGLAGACVKELDRRGGWTIFAADFNEAGLMELTSGTSGNVVPIVLDITNREDCVKAAEKTKEYSDHIDVVVNCAGIHTMGSLVEGDPAKTIGKMLDVNVLGMIRVNDAFFELVNACKGRIINFSSECGWEKPQPFNGPYAITKHAVEAYSVGLRRELSFLGVTVVNIQPGSFKTGMHGQAENGYDKLLKSTTHYRDVLSALKPIMTSAMKRPHDKKYLVDTVMKAISAKRPKNNYRCKNTWYLALLDPVPERFVEWGYKKVVSIAGKRSKP